MNQSALKLSGVAVAVAVAGLLAACAETQTSSSTAPAAASSSTADLAHCYGVNACKGHNDCGTAENDCAGKASCKGHGFVAMPTKACGDIGGTVKDAWRGSIQQADLAHCYEVNMCKGHNDCKTAENACAGHAVCKGHGFVAMEAAACENVGGKVGA